MAMTRMEWEAFQRRLPAEDRISYDDYLASQGLFAPPPSRIAAGEQGIIGARSIERSLTPTMREAIASIPSTFDAGASVATLTPTLKPTLQPTLKPTLPPSDSGTWVHDPSRTTENPDGSLNWFEYWSTDPNRTRVTRVTPQVIPGGDVDSNRFSSTPIPVVPTGPTAKQLASQSAFEIFRGFLRQYGLEALAADVEKYKLEGLSDEELLIRLRTESESYKRRFKANEQRLARGLAALSEAEYIGLEDAYQNVMRRYGLPESYYARGEMGRQEGFEKFIAGDVSPTELEERVQTAQNRIQNAPTQIKDALSQFYGTEISNGDVLAYVLDPDRALPQIKRKITAAEIGGAAAMAGLATGRTRAEELETFGVTGEAARQGFQTIAGVLPRASMLSDIYAKQGVGAYTQTTAEQEVFGLPSAAEATRRRQRLSELEQAQFAGQAGMAGGALSRERAGSI